MQHTLSPASSSPDAAEFARTSYIHLREAAKPPKEISPNLPLQRWIQGALVFERLVTEMRRSPMHFNVYRRAVAADKRFRSRQAVLNSTVRVGADVLHGFLPY